MNETIVQLHLFERISKLTLLHFESSDRSLWPGIFHQNQGNHVHFRALPSLDEEFRNALIASYEDFRHGGDLRRCINRLLGTKYGLEVDCMIIPGVSDISFLICFRNAYSSGSYYEMSKMCADCKTLDEARLNKSRMKVIHALDDH